MLKRGSILNKKGQDLTIGTLILIVLGVIILVLLILGFTVGWQNLFKKFDIYSGGSDINSVTQACNLDASSGNTFDYCQNYKQITSNTAGATEYINCEDSRVTPNLQKTLSCVNSAGNAIEECVSLLIGQSSSIKSGVNPPVVASVAPSSGGTVPAANLNVAYKQLYTNCVNLDKSMNVLVDGTNCYALSGYSGLQPVTLPTIYTSQPAGSVCDQVAGNISLTG